MPVRTVSDPSASPPRPAASRAAPAGTRSGASAWLGAPSPTRPGRDAARTPARRGSCRPRSRPCPEGTPAADRTRAWAAAPGRPLRSLRAACAGSHSTAASRAGRGRGACAPSDATAPTRWMSVRVVPRAISAAVDIEQGQMTAASGKDEPLEQLASNSPGRWTIVRSRGLGGVKEGLRHGLTTLGREAQLVGHDLDGDIGQAEAHVAAGGGDLLDETDCVRGAARTCDTNEERAWLGWHGGHPSTRAFALSRHGAMLCIDPHDGRHRQALARRHQRAGRSPVTTVAVSAGHGREQRPAAQRLVEPAPLETGRPALRPEGQDEQDHRHRCTRSGSCRPRPPGWGARCRRPRRCRGRRAGSPPAASAAGATGATGGRRDQRSDLGPARLDALQAGRDGAARDAPPRKASPTPVVPGCGAGAAAAARHQTAAAATIATAASRGGVAAARDGERRLRRGEQCGARLVCVPERPICCSGTCLSIS